MRLFSKLRHPVLLVGQGFLAGGLLFLAAPPEQDLASTPASQVSILSTVAPVR